MDYVIIGGDARMASLAEQLRRSSRTARHATGVEPDLEGIVAGARSVVVNNPPKCAKGVKLGLEDVLRWARPDARVFLCGPKPAEDLGDARIADLWRDEALLADNAYLTAEGALASAMRAGRRSLRDETCLIVGWGRIGRALAGLMIALSARVGVVSRTQPHRREAEALGARAFAPEDMPKALAEAGLVFSTPPAMVLDAKALESARPDAMVVDLASPPYGVDLHAAWARGLRAWREPGLPGRYCPESAARALLRAITRREARNNA